MCAVDSYQTGSQEEQQLSLVYLKLENVMNDNRQWAGFHIQSTLYEFIKSLRSSYESVDTFKVKSESTFSGWSSSLQYTFLEYLMANNADNPDFARAVQFLAHQWNQYEAGPTYNPRQQYRGRAGGQMAEQNNARRHQPYQRAPQIPPQRTLQSFLDCYPDRVQWLGHPERRFALWTEDEEMELVEGLRAGLHPGRIANESQRTFMGVVVKMKEIALDLLQNEGATPAAIIAHLRLPSRVAYNRLMDVVLPSTYEAQQFDLNDQNRRSEQRQCGRYEVDKTRRILVSKCRVRCQFAVHVLARYSWSLRIYQE
ncbi:hypothetical protein MP228_008178 [Amoeboaphelidium protococcarum]|nr:hypothetical protein MP228_008178 [Amoeboaphelidium protococcarum]